MKNKNHYFTNVKALSPKEISNAKGGIRILKPIYLCKYGMNCYNLASGPCPGETGEMACP
ncbi:MAG: hypothetical protein ACEPOZ_18625 [Marinifilaceae bacterium]